MSELILDESGQGLVEYGLILALISVAAVAAIVLIGPKTEKLLEDAQAEIAKAG